MNTSPIPIIDLFAGPGGLNEGFSSLGESDNKPVFSTVGSFEMEASACKTLTLRGTYRHLLRHGGVPDTYYEFIQSRLRWEEFVASPRVSEALQRAGSHVHQVELGHESDDSDEIIRHALGTAGVSHPESSWVLIGGPPCQAYSLAGRSRRTNDDTFADDKKHFLYREYLRIIRTFAPPVFVMENVKGLLSSTTAGTSMFDLIKADLERPGPGLNYEIHSLTVEGKAVDALAPSDFVIKAERYGVPQKRHRVILLGIREGFLAPNTKVGKLQPSAEVTVRNALHGMPRLRSGISPSRYDDAADWFTIRDSAANFAAGQLTDPLSQALTRGAPSLPRANEPSGPRRYAEWVVDHALKNVIQHESRSHMVEDLKRYFYAASAAKISGTSPKLRDFPKELLPNHKNATAEVRPFEDRFRVQLADQPSTTVVSHIAKDGHYYIHPDPIQMRSLTVREAARLQSFPDNYFFAGNRTQQYHQVGNAVPPLLAQQIAGVVAALFSDAPRP